MWIFWKGAAVSSEAENWPWAMNLTCGSLFKYIKAHYNVGVGKIAVMKTA